MQKTNDQNVSKAELLARIIYKAIVRYSLAQKDAKANKKTNLRLDCERIWSGNSDNDIDYLEDKLQ